MLIRTVIDIEAPAGRVWSILVDTAGYPEWNPLTTRIDGALAEGEVVGLHVLLGGRAQRRRHVVTRVEAERVLAWAIRTRRPWLLRGERRQTLTPRAGGCRYENEERVEGLLSPLVGLLYGRAVRRALIDVGRALKARAEAAGPG